MGTLTETHKLDSHILFQVELKEIILYALVYGSTRHLYIICDARMSGKLTLKGVHMFS